MCVRRPTTGGAGWRTRVWLRVLGSAAGGGFPQWNCGCPACRAVRDGSRPCRSRTQSSIVVSADYRRWFLINASPDIRAQIESFPRYIRVTAERPLCRRCCSPTPSWTTRSDCCYCARARPSSSMPPRGTRDVVRRDVVATDARALLPGQLATGRSGRRRIPRRRVVLPGLRCAHDQAGTLRARERAGTGRGVPPDRRGQRQGSGVPAGRAGAHARGARAAGRLRLPALRRDLLARRRVDPAGLARKTARDMGHLPIDGPDGSLEHLSALPIERKIYVHINNTNRILLEDAPERRRVEERGLEVAVDGLEVRV